MEKVLSIFKWRWRTQAINSLSVESRNEHDYIVGKPCGYLSTCAAKHFSS